MIWNKVLCLSHRAKSLSTPVLTGPHKQARGSYTPLKRMWPFFSLFGNILTKPLKHWYRRPEEKKSTVVVQSWTRKAADFGGDEEKDSASDRQQLDTSAQRQFLQGARLCRGSHEEVDPMFVTSGWTYCSSVLIWTGVTYLQVWVSGQLRHFASVPGLKLYIQLPSSAFSCCLLCSK